MWSVRHPAALVLMILGALLTFGAERLSKRMGKPEHMLKLKMGGCLLVVISAVLLLDIF